MKQNISLSYKLLLSPLFLFCISGDAAGPENNTETNNPNIVIILADDLGYTDVGCYGATKVKTPNIDRLAKKGILFIDAHSPAAVCAPSRYGLLTGQYPFRNPMFNKGVLAPYQPLGIDVKQTTIASLLKRHGYASGVFGKWHLGLGADPVTDFNSDINPGPMEIGFTESFIDPSNLITRIYVDGHRVVNYDPQDPFFWELTEAGKGMTDFRTSQPGGTPMAMHLRGGEKARIAKKPECTRVFLEKAVSFIDLHSKQSFLLYFTPHNVHLKIEPGPDFVGKSECGLYGDYIMELDWMVGEVLAALDRNSLTGKTLVLFTSDNGGGYYKPDVAEAFARGHRINGNLLGQKTEVWEGGHRIPFIVRWPGKVKPGTKSNQLISQVDIMATIAEILQIRLPDSAGPDSYSFLYALTGSAPPPTTREYIVYQGYTNGLLAIRQGSWVLIPAQGGDGASQRNLMTFTELGYVNSNYTFEGILKPDAPPGQLYDLSSDISQTTNLYQQYPEKVKELTMLLDQVRSRQINLH